MRIKKWHHLAYWTDMQKSHVSSTVRLILLTIDVLSHSEIEGQTINELEGVHVDLAEDILKASYKDGCVAASSCRWY